MSDAIGMHIHLRNVSIFAPLSGEIDDANIWSQKIKSKKGIFIKKSILRIFAKNLNFQKNMLYSSGYFKILNMTDTRITRPRRIFVEYIGTVGKATFTDLKANLVGK